MRSLVRAVLTLAALAVVGAPTVVPAPAIAASSTASWPPEAELERAINDERARAGMAPLTVLPVLRDQARHWAAELDRSDRLRHHPDLLGEAYRADPDWRRYGENVGVGGDPSSLHQAFMASDSHRANVLGSYRAVGVGVHESGGRLWVTVRFLA